MSYQPLVSVVINNFNYANFISEAIDSAISQTYPLVEVIVVDDGSTDNSLDIINSYGEQVICVKKPNGGQASSINAGVAASKGDIICFLDSDDVFYPNKVAEIVRIFTQATLKTPDVLLSNFFEVIDRDQAPIKIDVVEQLLFAPGEWKFLPKLNHQTKFFNGDLNQVANSEQVYQFANKYRFIPYLGVPTSSLSISRTLANKVFPILFEEGIKSSADVFFVKAASLLGTTYSTDKTLTKYRLHGNNLWFGQKDNKAIQTQINFFAQLDQYLNFKLVQANKQPCFSYMNSIVAKSYYVGFLGIKSADQIFQLAFKVIRWRIDQTTALFFIKTIVLSTWFKLKQKLPA
ncbi:MAG: glycosyltransferase family 2 protein [Pleurocapsa sp.]